METNYINDPKHFNLKALILQIEHLHWMSFLHPIVDAASGGPTGPSPPYRRSAAQHQAGHGCQNQRNQEGFQEQVLPEFSTALFSKKQKMLLQGVV